MTNRELFTDKPEHLVIEKFEDCPLADTQIRLKSEFSAIKHGTEFHHFTGKSPFDEMTFDGDMRMFIKKEQEDIAYHKTAFGNTTVGHVIEVGKAVTRFKAGDRVYAYGPIAERAVVEEQFTYPLPEAMNEFDAVCMDPALYALGAVRDSKARAGDQVVVFGLGAIGMLIIQLLKLSGCMEIIAVDPIEKRRKQAIKFGASLALDPVSDDIGLEVHRFLDNVGADIAIEASGNYNALYTAMKCVRKCGSIVTLGYYKGRDTVLALGQEWMHNRLTLISSMPTWDNPQRDYPLWDEQRMVQTLENMFIRKMITSEGIVEPVVSFDQSISMIMEIYNNPANSIKMGVSYD